MARLGPLDAARAGAREPRFGVRELSPLLEQNLEVEGATVAAAIRGFGVR